MAEVGSPRRRFLFLLYGQRTRRALRWRGAPGARARLSDGGEIRPPFLPDAGRGARADRWRAAVAGDANVFLLLEPVDWRRMEITVHAR
jgi:hypothetical protein